MPSRAKIYIAAAGALALLVGVWTWTRAGASESKGDQRKAPVVPVKTAAVESRSIPIQLRSIGQTEASSTVDVHPQVGGQLTRINFKEGDFVHKGDVLFGIDPRVSQTDVVKTPAKTWLWWVIGLLALGAVAGAVLALVMNR